MVEERKKEGTRGFSALGIPVGAVLVYKKDPQITVKTLDGKNKVEYQGKPYSISTLAKQLVGSPVSGYLYFRYGDKILKSLAKTEVKTVSPASPEPAKPGLKAEPAVTPGLAEESGEGEAGPDIDPLAGEIGEDSAESSPDEAGEEE